PLTYQQAASLLGVRADQVRKRIEHIRGELTDRGVLDLGNRQDAPRRLCEWYLSMRLLTRADLRAL
ncbi:MAG TPA: hypothetical protein VGF17_02395, partial [Phytomonospora sp.]